MADAVHTYLEDAFQRFLEKPVGATLGHSVQAQDDGDAILRRRSAVGKVAILAATPTGEEFLGGARSAPLIGLIKGLHGHRLAWDRRLQGGRLQPRR